MDAGRSGRRSAPARVLKRRDRRARLPAEANHVIQIAASSERLFGALGEVASFRGGADPVPAGLARGRVCGQRALPRRRRRRDDLVERQGQAASEATIEFGARMREHRCGISIFLALPLADRASLLFVLVCGPQQARSLDITRLGSGARENGNGVYAVHA